MCHRGCCVSFRLFCPMNRHSRESGSPEYVLIALDSYLRGNDKIEGYIGFARGSDDHVFSTFRLPVFQGIDK